MQVLSAIPVFILTALVVVLPIVRANEDYLDYHDLASSDVDPRLFVIVPSSTALNANSTVGILSVLGTAGLFTALVFVFWFFVTTRVPSNRYGYGGYYYQQQQPSYGINSPHSHSTSYQRRSTSDSVDWANLNILDYISMMEEMWRKFDVKDVECQKRVLCELHQNQASLGQPAEKVINAFGYLRYLSFMKLPADLNSLFDEYQEAADKGRTFNKDCGEIYNACNFSFKDTYLKYVGNKNSL